MRSTLLVLALVLFAGTTHAHGYGEDEDEEGYGGGGGGGGGGYGGDDEGGGGGGGGGSAPEELLTVEDFEAFLDDNDASVIAAFPAKEVVDPSAVIPDGWDEDEDGPWEAPTIEHPTLTSFNALSGGLYGYRTAFTSSPDVLAKLKCKSSGLFVYKSPRFVSKEHGDRPRERFPSDKLTESAVSLWLSSKAQPLVGQYSSTTKDRYKGPVLVLFMNLDFEKNAKQVNYVLKRARKVAVGLKGKLSIGVASASDMSYDLTDFGLTSSKPNTEILMGIKAGSDFYGSDAATFTAATLQAFADSFLKGELTPYVKPEPEEPPPSDDDEPMGDDEEGEEGGDDKEEM